MENHGPNAADAATTKQSGQRYGIRHSQQSDWRPAPAWQPAPAGAVVEERQPLLVPVLAAWDLEAYYRARRERLIATYLFLFCALLIVGSIWYNANGNEWDYPPYNGNDIVVPLAKTTAVVADHSHSIIQLKSLKSKYLPSRAKHGKHEKRVMVVGDVHGCKDDLVRLLDKLDYRASHDHIIFAGDMVDKGPKSHGVISLARSLDASCVRGNHEDHVLEAYRAGQLDIAESDDVSASWSRDMSQYTKADIDWIAKCPLILSLGTLPGLPFGQAVVVHAGLEPNVTLVKQDPFAVMTMRTISSSSHKPSADRDAGEPWWQAWNTAQLAAAEDESQSTTLVVYGHDSHTGLNEQTYSIGLDSACVGGGRLSALVFTQGKHGDTRTAIVSVKCKRK